METAYSQCQSCGMPLDKDRHGGGSEADGSRSRKYCSFCYREGGFVDPDLTLAEMRARVSAISKKVALKAGRPAARQRGDEPKILPCGFLCDKPCALFAAKRPTTDP